MKRWTSICVLGWLVCFPLNVFAAQQQPRPAKEQIVTLEESINATLRTHRDIKILQENREALQKEVRRAKAGYGPRVDLTGRAGVSELSDSTTRSVGADKGFYGANSVGATLIQPLWDGYATRSRVRAAESTLDSLKNRVFDNATTLALDSIIAHIDLLRLRKIVDLAEKNVARHEEILVSSRDRELMGTDTLADVTQAEGRLARAKSSQVEAQANLLSAEASYRRLTNRPTPAALTEVELPTPMYTSPDEVLTVAESDNPKIKAYLDDIKAAQGQKELMDSAFHPVFNLEAGPNYTDRSGRGDQWTRSMDVMGVVRWNIFNSGADEAGSRAAAARVRQSRQTLFNLKDELVLQTDEAWTRYQEAIRLHKTYSDAMHYNLLTKDAYLEQFYTGQRRLLDVLDAENELYNSSTQAVTAAGNILVSGYKLYALAGVLLPVLHINTKGLDENPPMDDADPAMIRPRANQ